MKKAALITGSTRRIGKAIALSLAQRGFDIALHCRVSHGEAEEVVGEITLKGQKCQLFPCDFNDIKQVRSLIPAVYKKFPYCVLLVNNASIFKRARLMNSDEDIYNAHFNINIKPPFFLSKDFAQHCRSGHIINMLDACITRSSVEYFAYSLTKKALYEFTRSAAKELGPDIRVNAIAPGLILPSNRQNESDFKEMGSRVPLQRVGDIDNILSALHLLIENPFITGECIFIDGGEHLR